MSQRLRLEVNRRVVEVEVPDDATLLEVLREDLGLTGTKYGCGYGRCGACTVVVGDKALRACRTSARSVVGQSVLMIEGLANGAARPDRVQQAFLEADALECGYCTPGFIMEVWATLRRGPPAGSDWDEAWGQVLRGHICRCGSYQRIQRALQLLAPGDRSPEVSP